MTSAEVEALTEYFRSYVSEHKQQLFEEVLNKRTKHLTVVLEDIYQPQNASAVIRTCDCLGIQEIHIIENENQYKLNKDVILGAYKWVDIIQHNTRSHNTIEAIDHLKSKGYKIVITDPNPDLPAVDQLDINSPIALIFGTEKTGLSREAVAMADKSVTFPMHGFTESFNVSVSAALFLYTLRRRLEKEAVDYTLSPMEKDLLRLQWYKQMVKQSELHEEQFLKKLSKDKG